MHRLSFILRLAVLMVGPISVTQAAAPQLLDTAVQKLIQEGNEWAFTEIIRRTDRAEGETIARFDPSRPEGERWELVQLKGRIPTAQETKQWLAKGQRDRAESEESSLFELMDLDQARAVEETISTIRYEVPFKKELMVGRIPTEPFVAWLTVSKSGEAVEHASLRSKGAFRVAGVAQIDSVEGEVTFKRIDGSAVPRPAFIRASRTGHVFFVRLDGSAEVTYTDHRRVSDR